MVSNQKVISMRGRHESEEDLNQNCLFQPAIKTRKMSETGTSLGIQMST